MFTQGAGAFASLYHVKLDSLEDFLYWDCFFDLVLRSMGLTLLRCTHFVIHKLHGQLQGQATLIDVAFITPLEGV